MNYTREPIIETVITPKEGSKLVLRNSKKQSAQEDFFVDSVEIVSFGSSLFFRSIERPKPFLLPVTDYEVLELRETKMVLKSASLESPAIKIGGGKENKPAPIKERAEPSSLLETPPPVAHLSERKGKRRSRRRRMGGGQQHTGQDRGVENATKPSSPLPVEEEVKTIPPPILSTLLIPPTGLIKEKLIKYRAVQEEKTDIAALPPLDSVEIPVQEETNPS